jgi:ubiquinone/menaquinone biosynthesis C-methylase UbiE
MPEVKGKRVLDAGCGTGVYSEWLITIIYLKMNLFEAENCY